MSGIAIAPIPAEPAARAPKSGESMFWYAAPIDVSEKNGYGRAGWSAAVWPETDRGAARFPTR